jgi:hypothetical protein
VTVTQDQIQRLLTEVQDVLAQGNPRLPWGSGAQIARQRQILEQVRIYLQTALIELSQPKPNQTENQAQDVMQAVIEEMNALRSTLLRPLHSEVSTLMQQRNALQREIRQLEAHRELLEQPTAAPQNHGNLPTEKLQVVHEQADQILTTLDTTLHVVFESLQKDIHAYQDSLSQGIDKLHTLGQQSEVMFSGIVGRLATQMGRDASAFLQSSSGQNNSLPLAMPYAGAELPAELPTKLRRGASEIDSITVLTELIDQLAIEVDELPVSVPIVPPRNGSSSGREASAELKSLFQGDSPNVEPSIEPNGYRALNQETSFDQLEFSTPASYSPVEEPMIFTLEGVENLFDDELENLPNG